MGISTTRHSSVTRNSRRQHPIRLSRSQSDPVIHLHVGPTLTHMTIPQRLITGSSPLLARHLRSQVPNLREFVGRDKEMRMRCEAVDVVQAFHAWVETASYSDRPDSESSSSSFLNDGNIIRTVEDPQEEQITEDQVALDLRVHVFAVKYEISGLAVLAGRRAREGLGALMRARRGKSKTEWKQVCEEVLDRALEMGGVERQRAREALEWLGRPLIWSACGEVWS